MTLTPFPGFALPRDKILAVGWREGRIFLSVTSFDLDEEEGLPDRIRAAWKRGGGEVSYKRSPV